MIPEKLSAPLGSMEEARIFRSMPLVHRAFKTLADHVP